MLPNTDQVLSLVRAILVIVGTFLTTKGLVSTADWTTYTGAILMIVPPIWGLFAHTDASHIATVTAMTGAKITVDRTTATSPALLAAAADPAQVNVIPKNGAAK